MFRESFIQSNCPTKTRSSFMAGFVEFHERINSLIIFNPTPLHRGVYDDTCWQIPSSVNVSLLFSFQVLVPCPYYLKSDLCIKLWLIIQKNIPSFTRIFYSSITLSMSLDKYTCTNAYIKRRTRHPFTLLTSSPSRRWTGSFMSSWLRTLKFWIASVTPFSEL